MVILECYHPFERHIKNADYTVRFFKLTEIQSRYILERCFSLPISKKLSPDAMMSRIELDQIMGIEMRLHLVDGSILNSILEMEWSRLVSGMESSSLRKLRPNLDSKLGRDFDIDCEAEFLDLADNISGTGSTRSVLFENSAYDALLKLVEWSSIGHWEAWEGRCFLYIENAIGRELGHVDDMYTMETWDEMRTNLSKMSESEFAEKVCEDWMNRRKEMGETLDEKKDPRIIPTFEAHDRNSRTLHHAVNVRGFVQILGREHLDAQLWGHGEWNLGNLLDS